VAAAFGAAHPEFQPLSCAKVLEGQRIALDTGEHLKLSPHRHGTDAFFAAAFERRKG
jgi:16S rRNA (cytosine967-C5)-methyltransferase